MKPTPRLIPSEKNWAGQFVVNLSDISPIQDTSVVSVNGVVLQVFPGLRIVPVFDQTGAGLGWLLGEVIDYEAKALVTDRVTISFDVGSNLDTAIENFIYRFSGRFVFVLASEKAKRIYLDACGSLSLVYDPAQRRAASSTGLLLNDGAYAARFDDELYNFLNVPDDGWFPGGLTAHTGINRLICNHYLDLTSWRSVRHWPDKNLSEAPDPQSNVDRICDVVRSSVTALRRHGRTVMALTAGNETRLLLASSKEAVEDVEFVTVDAPTSHLDVFRACQLAQRFRLRHNLLPLVTASEEQALQFRYQAGHCIGGSNVWTHPSINPLCKFDFFVGGLGGEIGRAFFWRSSDNNETNVTPKSIAYRMGMPIHSKVLSAVENWFDEVKDFNPLLQIDLAYLELRMSCWGFAQAYSHPVVPHIHPLISRETFRLMLELPPTWKRGGLLITKGIETQWPELLSLPINRYGDARDFLLKVSKAIRNPRLIAKKIRKKFGRP